MAFLNQLAVLISVLWSGTALGGAGQSKESGKKPNFVVIFTDDQGYQDIGCFGSPDIKTPRLDQMAKEGLKLTSFYAQTICGPSRASIMTGCYPLRVAQKGNQNSVHPVMHSDEVTIAEVLKDAGYTSGAFGKWGLAFHDQNVWNKELMPTHQGFDYFFGTASSNDREVHLIRNGEYLEKQVDMATVTKRYTDEAIGFIEKNQKKPFFVYLAHTMPHTILAASEDFKGKSKAGLYGDVIEEIDFNVGRIIDTLKKLGIDDNTYVLFTSDNGPWIMRKKHGGRAAPLRSGKTTCWEGGLRVPCIVRASGKIPAGSESDLVTSTMDLLPTFAKLAGVKPPQDRVIDGVDISEVLHGKQDSLDRVFYYYQQEALRAVRKGKWKLMLKHEDLIWKFWGWHVKKGDAQPIVKNMLFNLDENISETKDVSANHPEVVIELLKIAEKGRNDIGDIDRLGKNARFFDNNAPRKLVRKGEVYALLKQDAARRAKKKVDREVK